MRIGGHFHTDNPLADAVASGAGAAQFFLGDPQGWKGPTCHANFESGTIDKSLLRDVVRAAAAPVICETPEAGLASDIHWLQTSLSA